MKIMFKSHGFLNNSKTEIHINIMPFKKDSDDYKYISKNSNDYRTEELKKLLETKTIITIKDTDRYDNDRETELVASQSEEIEIINLIHNISISRLVDDAASVGVCDGGSFTLSMEGIGWSLWLSSCNTYHAAIPSGLPELINKIKELQPSRELPKN